MAKGKVSNRHMLNYLHQFSGQKITVDIVVLNKIYYNEDNVFGVYEVAIEDKYVDVTKVFTVVGNVEMQIDKTYQVTGEVIYDDKYGFEIVNPQVLSRFPKKKETIKRLLAKLNGIGPAKSTLLVSMFGEKALDVLLNEPDRILKEVNGIGEKTLKKASKHLLLEKERFNAIESLAGAGLSPKLANTLLTSKNWKETFEIVKSNPYKLIESGDLSFNKADEVASQLGISPDNPNRIKSAIRYALKLDATANGNCYCEKHLLNEYVTEILTVFLPIEKTAYVTFKNGYAEANYFNVKKQFAIAVYNRYKEERVMKKHLITNQYYERGVLKMYGPAQELIDECMDELKRSSDIYIDEENNVSLNTYEEAETIVAERITRIKRNKVEKFSKEEAQKTLDSILTEHNITLSPDQNDAIISMAISDGGMNLLLGSAGCGKTFSLKLFIQLYKKLRHILYDDSEVVTILAPTGRASKVATMATGIQAYTIHRACGFDEKTYVPANTIMTDIIVVDETSMLDVKLAATLLMAANTQSKVIFIGDIKQLAPIGAGRVLFDIIASNCVDTYTLSTNQRQKDNSGIIFNANKIIESEMVEDKPDCHVVFAKSDEMITREIFDDFKTYLKKYSIEDIQIISPMKKHDNGVDMLNYEIQRIYNPILKEDEKKKITKSFMYKGKMTPLYLHKGDKVINIKNDINCIFFKKVKTAYGTEYKPNGNKQIANGEIGVVTSIQYTFSEEFFQKIEVVIVKFDDGYAFFYEKPSQTYCNLANLNLAYAITIHKSQGSQWKHVIFILSKQHGIMATNNLLYTATTRAQKDATIICDAHTFEKGLTVFASLDRKTKLSEKLKSMH